MVRTKGQPELHVVGRDIEENAYAMRFDGSTKTWTQLGKADEIQKTVEQQQLYDALKEADDPLSPKELADITGLRVGYIKNTLPKLLKEGGVAKVGYGRYVYSEYSDDCEYSSDESIDEESSEYPESSDISKNDLDDLM